MRRRIPALLAALAALAAASPSSAVAAVGVVRVGTFAQPVLVAAAPGDPSRRLPGLTSFGEDGRGRIYLAALGGAVYRLVPR